MIVDILVSVIFPGNCAGFEGGNDTNENNTDNCVGNCNPDSKG